MIAMQRIAGIDFSLAKTGIAIATQRADGTVIMVTSTVTSRGFPGDTLAARAHRLNQLAHDVTRAVIGCELTVLEDRVVGARGGDIDRLWAGWWLTAVCLHKAEIPVATVNPTSLKLAIAGKSQVDKSVLGRHVVKLWPDLEYANDNEADAAGLAHLGAVRLGWDVPTLQRHRDVKGEWPEFGPTADVEVVA